MNAGNTVPPNTPMHLSYCNEEEGSTTSVTHLSYCSEEVGYHKCHAPLYSLYLPSSHSHGDSLCSPMLPMVSDIQMQVRRWLPCRMGPDGRLPASATCGACPRSSICHGRWAIQVEGIHPSPPATPIVCQINGRFN
jgi:hypothetical protein